VVFDSVVFDSMLLWRRLVLGILLAHGVTGATVPQAVLRRFESDAAALQLSATYSGEFIRCARHSAHGSYAYNIQLLGFHDRVRLLLSLDDLRPGERDRAAIHLPSSLDFLYYLVRPVRLLWDRSARK